MIQIKGNPDGQFSGLARMVARVDGDMKKELRAVLNATAKKTKTSTKEPKGIRQRVSKLYARGTIPAKAVGKLITVDKASKSKLRAAVSLDKSKRPSIKYFKPKEIKVGRGNKRRGGGVRYKVSPGKTITNPKAFRVDKLGGHYFERIGKARKPIARVDGVSPWGMYVKNNLGRTQRADVQFHLRKQTRARIKYLILREQKKLRGTQRY